MLSKLRERLGFGELRWALSERRRSPGDARVLPGIASQSPRFDPELSCVATASIPRQAAGHRRKTTSRAAGQDRPRQVSTWSAVQLVMKGYRKNRPRPRRRSARAAGYTPEMSSISAPTAICGWWTAGLIINAATCRRPASRTPSWPACPQVRVLLAIGDGRTYNTALLVFDAGSLGPYAASVASVPRPRLWRLMPGGDRARIAAGRAA